MSAFFAMLDVALRASQYANEGNYKQALEMMRLI
jgi:hypothetical protein